VSTKPIASYIIPYRSQDGWRENNLIHIVRFLKDLIDLEIIIVEEGPAPISERIAGELEVTYQFIESHEGFNKSKAMNLGSKVAKSDTLIFGDADMLVPMDILCESIDACGNFADAINPYQYLCEFNQDQTRGFYESLTIPDDEKFFVSKRQSQGEILCFCGGLFLIKKSVFEKLNGMDERFVGWGGEDDAFSIKLFGEKVELLERSNQYGYHLFHPRDTGLRYEHKDYQNNVNLLKDYRERYGTDK
jgi:predicted glycosyltransferase involved in capsule biosynthesis